MHSTDFDNAQDDRSMENRVQNLEKIVVEQQHQMKIQQDIIQEKETDLPPSYQSSIIQQPYVSSGPVVDLESERKLMGEEYSDASDDEECEEVEDDKSNLINPMRSTSRTLSVHTDQEALI